MYDFIVPDYLVEMHLAVTLQKTVIPCHYNIVSIYLSHVMTVRNQ